MKTYRRSVTVKMSSLL